MGSHGKHKPWRSKVKSSQHLVRIKSNSVEMHVNKGVCVITLSVCVSRPLQLSRQEADGTNGRAAGEEAESAGTAERTIG